MLFKIFFQVFPLAVVEGISYFPEHYIFYGNRNELRKLEELITVLIPMLFKIFFQVFL